MLFCVPKVVSCVVPGREDSDYSFDVILYYFDKTTGDPVSTESTVQ